MFQPPSPLLRWSDIIAALGLLSRLPVRPGEAAIARGARAAWAYPVIGGILGALAALAGLLAIGVGLPPVLAAIVTLSVQIVLTGALHEDGLADTADGLWGGWTVARRLEIMKDSHIGPYGVIALMLSLLARWAALWLLFETGGGAAFAAILVAAAVSRAMLPALMWGLPHARASGLSRLVGRVGGDTLLLALGLAFGLSVLLAGGAGVLGMLWAGLAILGLGLVARARIGGQTGDILGAGQQLAEIAVLFALIA